MSKGRTRADAVASSPAAALRSGARVVEVLGHVVAVADHHGAGARLPCVPV